MVKWSANELIIALEFYHTCPERMWTDSHPKCREIAAMLDRTPGALDKILRNIKSADKGGAGLPNASRTIRNLVDHYRGDIPKLKARAAAIRAENGWLPLVCED
jgi:hypothetical protein